MSEHNRASLQEVNPVKPMVLILDGNPKGSTFNESLLFDLFKAFHEIECIKKIFKKTYFPSSRRNVF